MNIAVTSMPPASSEASMGQQAPRRWLARGARAVWRALEASGRARAHAHLRVFAEQCESMQPELAKELRAALSTRDAA